MKNNIFLTLLSFQLLFVIFNFSCTKLEPVSVTKFSSVQSSSQVSYNSASVTAKFMDIGNEIVSYGHCWATAQNPTINNFKTTLSGKAIKQVDFTSNLTGLSSGTSYYVRAYVVTNEKTIYSSELKLTTLVLPLTVSTTVISSITNTTAVSGGSVTANPGTTVSARGVCWSIIANPNVLLGTKTTDGYGNGTFTSSIPDLTTNTTYFVRAYATCNEGTAYGNEISFTTSSQPPVFPTLTTAAATLITLSGASSGGNISSDGGATVSARGICWSKTTNPTITLSTKTSDSTGIGSFTSLMTGLNSNTIYFVRAYATNSVGTAYGNEISFTTSKVTDADGNIYKTVIIGTQIWLAENLKTTRYMNGDLIGTTSPATLDISAESMPKYQWAYNGDEANAAIYGRLYTWYAATDSRSICPVGWHLPADSEYTTLVTYLGGVNIAGGKLKEVGIAHWESPNADADNSSGFTALAAGARSYSNFYDFKHQAYFWTATLDIFGNGAYVRTIQPIAGPIYDEAWTQERGYSVRCLKD